MVFGQSCVPELWGCFWRCFSSLALDAGAFGRVGWGSRRKLVVRSHLATLGLTLACVVLECGGIQYSGSLDLWWGTRPSLVSLVEWGREE